MHCNEPVVTSVCVCNFLFDFMARDSSEFSVLATALGIDRCLLLVRRSAANLPHAAAAAVKLLLFEKKILDPGTQFPGNEKLSLCSTKKYLTPPLDRLRPSGSLVHGMPAETRARLTKSVLFFSRPRSEGWSYRGRTFSIYPCPLSFSLTLSRRVLSTS